MLRLVKPSVKYKESFIKDFFPFMGKSRVKYENLKKNFPGNAVKKNFPKFLKYIKEQEKGLNLPKGYIPQSVYWLVDGNKMLGWLSLRHYLNTNLRKMGGHIGYEIGPKYRGRGFGNAILKLGLKKARARGIARVFITCDEDNFKSKKVIEHHGGIAIKKFWMPQKKLYKLRYWIETK